MGSDGVVLSPNRQKPSSVDHKERYLRLYVLPLLGKRRLDEIRNEDVQRLKTLFENKSAKTANNALTVLGKMLRVAVEWGVLKEMPCQVRLLKTKHVEMEFYEEAIVLLNSRPAAAGGEKGENSASN